MINSVYAVYFCPGLYCKVQRTWHTKDSVIYTCDHCGLRMRHDRYRDRFVLV